MCITAQYLYYCGTDDTWKWIGRIFLAGQDDEVEIHAAWKMAKLLVLRPYQVKVHSLGYGYFYIFLCQENSRYNFMYEDDENSLQDDLFQEGDEYFS